MAAVHHTFTHKQYTKYRERRIWEVRAVPRLCELYLAFALQLRKKQGTLSLRVVEKCPDIPVAFVQYTQKHKYFSS